jgi:hypothetical protein
MTTTLIFTGVTLWIGFWAFVVFGPQAGPVEAPARHRSIDRNRRR